jgi:mannose-6-phosphate isomerase-like protein (cupin superfamily)
VRGVRRRELGMGKVQFLQLQSDAEVVDLFEGLVTSRRLVRKVHGSGRMSFNVSTLREGLNEEVTHEDADEILYLLEGEVEVSAGGEIQSAGPGTAIFIPQGTTYRYRVTKGPNEVVAVFSPPHA